MASANNTRTIGWASLVVLIALYVVGAVSVPPGSLRHEIQTLPLWVPIVAGFQRRHVAKWAALPCLIFWLVIMVFIWLFLLGFARIVSGYFSPTEIAMTLVVGAASIIGLVTALRMRAPERSLVATSWFVVLGILQITAFWLSLFPYFAHR